MRVTRIELKNFRNYEHLVLDLDQGEQARTLLIGENGTGKSTIIDAVAYAHLGRCRGVDGKGSGQKELIRAGSDAMQVTVWTDTLGPVTRGISLAGSATSSMPTPMVLGRLGVSEGMLTAVLYGRAFFDMHHSDATALLLKLLDVTVTRDQLPGIDLPADLATVDLPYLESLYDTEYQNRAALKKTLANHHVMAPPKVASIELAGKTLDELKAQQAAVQNVLRTNQQAATRAEVEAVQVRNQVAAGEQAEASLGKIEGGRDSHVDMLAEHQARLNEATADLQQAEAIPFEPVGNLQAQQAELTNLADKIGRHILHTTGSAPGAKKKKALPVEDATPHSCILGAGIECRTPAADFGAAVAQVKAQIIELGTRITAGNQRAGAIAAAQQSVKNAERDVVYHQTQIRNADDKLTAAKAAVQQLPALRTRLTDLEATLIAANKAVADGTLAVAKLTDQVGQLAAYHQALAGHQDSVKKLADLQAQVTESERKVDLLGPNGIRKQALQSALADFEAVINAALEHFGFVLTIQAEGKGLNIRVATPQTGGESLPYALLSDGQKLWTGMAFQLALAAVSGLDFCIIDGAETVVGKNRAVLTGLVMGAPVGQVIVAMAKGDEEAAPDIDGLQVIRVQPAAAAAAA